MRLTSLRRWLLLNWITFGEIVTEISLNRSAHEDRIFLSDKDVQNAARQ